MRLKHLLAGLVLASAPMPASCAANYTPSTITPPKLVREFRGIWIATVANIDWPSKPGLSTAEQKRELIAILDRAAQLKLNAVIFQVRPACDAMYASPIEPWSEYLTGTMGKAPEPFYDPLAFAVAEAHRRGLELHAWFNPYRALHFSSKSPIAASHISQTHPALVRKSGQYLWLDPGEPAVQDYSLSVVLDVVRRYDIDAVHFDDYFYPERGAAGADSDFPDEESWKEYGARSGLSRDDWRRQNVNQFIQRVGNSIKAAKPSVEFGISPFGIWRPGHPPQIRGKDAYAELSADSRKWLADGWVDYLAPQLYWPMESKEQNFSALLGWWAEQNLKGRHLWPGIDVAKAEGWKPDEIPNQIRRVRQQSGVTGYVLYSAGSLMRKPALTQVLERDINSQPALVPASPWLDPEPPKKPALTIGSSGFKSTVKADWQVADEPSIRFWVLQTRSGGSWKTEILPADKTTRVFAGAVPEVIAVRAVDRAGVASEPAVAALRN